MLFSDNYVLYFRDDNNITFTYLLYLVATQVYAVAATPLENDNTSVWIKYIFSIIVN